MILKVITVILTKLVIKIFINDNTNKNYERNITKTNELFDAGAVVVTNRLEVKINKAAERK